MMGQTQEFYTGLVGMKVMTTGWTGAFRRKASSFASELG